MELPLTQELRAELLRKYKRCKELKVGNRLNMILLLDEGYTLVQVSEILRCDSDTVANWRDKFRAADTIDSFVQTHYYSPSCRLSQEDIDFLSEHIRLTYITNSSQLIAFIKTEFNVSFSASGVRKLLKSMGFTYKQLSLFPAKADERQQEEFVESYQKLEGQLQDNETIMFLDAAHPCHNVKSARTWSPKGVRDIIQSNTGRHRVNINGAYNPYSQNVITTFPDTVNAQTTVELFEKILQQQPDKTRIYLIADNARYYRSKVVTEFLAKNPKLVIKHLPPYSPNLNLIERLWKFMRKKIMNTVYYPTASEFEAAISSFFDQIHTMKDALSTFIGTKFQMLS